MILQELSISSEDRVTKLRGELTLPDNQDASPGALLIVPGGWFAERDGFMGDTYTEADLMYRRIARRVLARNIAVVRYDNRGVVGNELTIGITKDSSDPEGDSRRYLSTCIDSSVRASVTPESLMSDAAVFYDFIKQHPLIDPGRIVVFAHSEGGLHVARLIGCKRIDPKGLVFAGTLTGSPLETMKWQAIDRYVDEVLSWDRQGNERVDSQDVARHYATSIFPAVGIPQADLQPDELPWTQAKLREYFTSKYEKERTDTLAIADDVPFPLNETEQGTMVGASHRWMKQWYCDDRSVVSLLGEYGGRIAFHFGELDRQLSVQNEIANIQRSTPMLAATTSFVLHRRRGHAFCTDKPVAGPMDEEAENLLVDEIAGMLAG